jgi:hypothetical protein
LATGWPLKYGGTAITIPDRMPNPADLPQPASAAAALSEALAGLITREIEAAGGAIPFSRYMELCLYAPGLGYYSAGQRKFGAGGDFVTAPEVSSLFGRCLARCCAAVLQQTGGDVLEFGAGSGRLAVDLLGELAGLGCPPRQYFILERSADLQQRQQQLLRRELPQLVDRVVWLERLPQAGFRSKPPGCRRPLTVWSQSAGCLRAMSRRLTCRWAPGWAASPVSSGKDCCCWLITVMSGTSIITRSAAAAP